MSETAKQAAVQDPAKPIDSDTALPAAGVMDELSGALLSARTTLSSFLELVALEARRAGHALMWMVACALAATVCVLAAWFGLMAALVMTAVHLGAPLVVAMLSIAVLNCICGAILIYLFVARTRDVAFKASRRRFAAGLCVKPSLP